MHSFPFSLYHPLLVVGSDTKCPATFMLRAYLVLCWLGYELEENQSRRLDRATEESGQAAVGHEEAAVSYGKFYTVDGGAVHWLQGTRPSAFNFHGSASPLQTCQLLKNY